MVTNKTTDQLAIGDVVSFGSKRVLLDTEPIMWLGENIRLTVYRYMGKVLQTDGNPDGMTQLIQGSDYDEWTVVN